MVGVPEGGCLAHDEAPALPSARGDVDVGPRHPLDLVILVHAAKDLHALRVPGLRSSSSIGPPPMIQTWRFGICVASDPGGLDDVLRTLVGHEPGAPDHGGSVLLRDGGHGDRLEALGRITVSCTPNRASASAVDCETTMTRRPR